MYDKKKKTQKTDRERHRERDRERQRDRGREGQEETETERKDFGVRTFTGLSVLCNVGVEHVRLRRTGTTR